MKKKANTTKNKIVSRKRLKKTSQIGNFLIKNKSLAPLINLLSALIELIKTFI